MSCDLAWHLWRIGSMAASPLSVLVAEDNEDIRELVSHQLRRMGVLVLLAEDGRRALDLALAQRPTLVLMDMDMPVMSGFDAVAALRAQGYRGSIFALTAYQDGPEAERALSSGCDALLGKPITSERLRNHVTQALARASSGAVQ
jgi:CheY-like chemotaxis protein